MTATHAYREVYGCTEAAAASRASALLRNAKVAERILELRKEASSKCTDAGFLTMEEKRRALAQIFRASASSVLDRNGRIDLEKVKSLAAWCVQKIRVIESKNGKGLCRRVEVEFTDRLKAVELDNELAGDAPTLEDDVTTAERIARRKRAIALLRTLPGHGGHLLAPIECVLEPAQNAAIPL